MNPDPSEPDLKGRILELDDKLRVELESINDLLNEGERKRHWHEIYQSWIFYITWTSTIILSVFWFSSLDSYLGFRILPIGYLSLTLSTVLLLVISSVLTLFKRLTLSFRDGTDGHLHDHLANLKKLYSYFSRLEDRASVDERTRQQILDRLSSMEKTIDRTRKSRPRVLRGTGWE